MSNAQLTHLESLQAFLTARIAPARALGVTVAATEPVTISAPLEGNLNDKGTGFAGSLFSVAALAGWALVTRWCAVEPIEGQREHPVLDDPPDDPDAGGAGPIFLRHTG